jgi:hypothetical protein
MLIWVHKEMESPDPEKWPEWIPYARYRLSWTFHPEEVGDHSKASIHFYAYAIGDRGSNLNYNQLPGGYEGTLTGKVAPGEEIELVIKGEDDLGEDVLAWDLNLKTTILAKTAE